MSDFRPALERLLKDADCYLARQGKGSHSIWYSPKSRANFSVPSKIKSRHTANGILKQAGLPKAF